MANIRKFNSIVLIFILVFNLFNINVSAGSNTNKVEIEDFNLDGFQTFRFYVSSKISTSKYKYKTIGWRIHIAPDGTDEVFDADIPYQFKDANNDQVDLDLITKIFDPAGVSQIHREVGGVIEADAIQIILIYGVPMGTNNEPVDPSTIIGWEKDMNILLNNANVKKFSDPYYFDNEKNKLSKPIISGLPKGIPWSTKTQSDLQYSYYDNVENYKPVAESVDVTLKLETTSSLDEHTLDMSKGEGQATARIHASGTVKPEPDQVYAQNHNNIRYISININDIEKKLYPGTDFTSLNYDTEFTFNYLPHDIEDGDSDMNDEVRKDYSGNVHVEYKKKYYGDSTDSTEANLIKKAPIPDGDPLAILSVPDQVLVDEEILADGSGSIAPEGATLVNYTWEVENEALTKEDGNKSIKLTYDEPKTVTVALTVEDSNGKTDTAMKDVKIIKKASPPINWSPEVTLSGPTIVMQGDSFNLRVNATDHEDGPLTPTLSKPSSLVLSGQYITVITPLNSCKVASSPSQQEQQIVVVRVIVPVPK